MKIHRIVNKRRISIAAVLLAVMLTEAFFAGALTNKAHADSLYIIRVGLTEHLKQQSSVKISTKKIALGYCVNNRFYEYIHFENKKGFTFVPATGYYLVSDTVYPTYADAKKAYDKARKISGVKENVKLCMLGKNKWGIYVGGSSNVASVSALSSKLDGKLDTTFGAVTSYNGQRVEIKGGDTAIMYDGADTGQYVQISANVLNKKGSKTLSVNGYEYRGRLEIGPYGSKDLTIVNITNVENYLRSVVGSEMNSTYPMEAMKAQAIVSRTYAQNHCNNTGDTNTSTPYSINDTETYQRYRGYSKETKRSVEAVTSTRGVCIYSGGEQIDAGFFHSSGGVTEDARYVTGITEKYLKSVADLDDLMYGEKPWIVTYTAEELGKSLGIGKVQSISVDSVTQAGRIYQMTVSGDSKSLVLKGDNIRSRLGIKSSKCRLITKDNPQTEVSVMDVEGIHQAEGIKNCYAINGSGKVQSLNRNSAQYVVAGAYKAVNYMKELVTGDNTYTFAGMGNGSGVGMSQAGAKRMAEYGAGYEEIIKKYYGPKVSIR